VLVLPYKTHLLPNYRNNPNAISQPLSQFALLIADVVALGGRNSPGLEQSFGSRTFRARGFFDADLHFASFPFDRQELNVTLQMTDLPLRKASLVSRADPMPSVEGAGELPLWSTFCVHSSSHVTDYSQMGNNAPDHPEGAEDPYFAYGETMVTTLSTDEMIAELYTLPDILANNATTLDEKSQVRRSEAKAKQLVMISSVGAENRSHIYLRSRSTLSQATAIFPGSKS